MRSRVIRQNFFLEESLCDLGAETRLLFLGLLMICDREGRIADSPRRIRAEVLPYDPESDVDQMLAELDRAGKIVRYQVDGQAVIAIPRFAGGALPFWTHVYFKEKASVLPGPEGVIEGWAELSPSYEKEQGQEPAMRGEPTAATAAANESEETAAPICITCSGTGKTIDGQRCFMCYGKGHH